MILLLLGIVCFIIFIFLLIKDKKDDYFLLRSIFMTLSVILIRIGAYLLK